MDLKCGIKAKVRRDGTFLFDFSSWALAPSVVIPGYRRPNTDGPYYAPIESGEAEEEAEVYAIVRAQVMNVHQACLTTAESQVKHRTAATGFPLTAWNTHKAITFEAVTPYYDDVEDIHALAQNVINGKYGAENRQALPRRVLELEVVERSLRLLDQILLKEDLVLIQMIEAIYIASCRLRDKRVGETVALAWSVCEQLVFVLWKQDIDAKDVEIQSARRINKERRKKLTGRDYSASVVLEILELQGCINTDLYRLLDLVRRARNKWVHELRIPKNREAQLCLVAAQQLLKIVMKIDLSISQTTRGGVPQWPIWMWNKFKEQGES